MKFDIKLLDKEMSKAPTRAYNSIGFDCYAFGHHIINIGECRIIPLGFSAYLDPGYGAFAWDRGSLGSKGIHTFHELITQLPEQFHTIPFAGVIDPDYRGQWGTALYNFGKKEFNINHGDKIVQFVILKCELPEISIVDELDLTLRGGKALGSSDAGTTEQEAQNRIRGSNWK